MSFVDSCEEIKENCLLGFIMRYVCVFWSKENILNRGDGMLRDGYL